MTDEKSLENFIKEVKRTKTAAGVAAVVLFACAAVQLAVIGHRLGWY